MLSCFPRDVLDEIWDLIASVSEGLCYLCYVKRLRCKYVCFINYSYRKFDRKINVSLFDGHGHSVVYL